MPYIPHTDADRQAMLEAIGTSSLDELLAPVPDTLRLKRPLDLPPPLSEPELVQHVSRLAALNRSASDLPCFLGAGAYDHYVPAVVDHLAGRSEFLTAYTPYQAEISQGVLQSIYEFQSLICDLTGMEVANASMYDGATALAEAGFMALRCVRQSNALLVSSSVHPHARQVLRAYADGLDIRVREIPLCGGLTDLDALKKALTPKTAAVILQHPNFFGCLEEVRQAADLAHGAGALLIVSVDPVSLGLLQRPGDLGADVAVGECQGLGTPLSYGGPYAGFFASRTAFVRQMPGRIAGKTVDVEGKPGYVLTLQAREQHIRRARATSNICTNEAWIALRATIHLATLGRAGLREVARLCLQKAHYLKNRLAEIGLEPAFSAPFFKEFVVKTPVPPARLNRRLLKAGILGGLDLGAYSRRLKGHWLLCVTEKRTKEEMDRLVETIRGGR